MKLFSLFLMLFTFAIFPTTIYAANYGEGLYGSGYYGSGDTTAPTGGSVTYTNGYNTTATISLVVDDGNDNDSGINTSSRILQRRNSSLSAGTCGSYNSFGTITPSGTYPNFTDSTLSSGYCYQYQYLVSDNDGNQATYTSANVVKVDISLPSTPDTPSVTTPTNSLSQNWSWTVATDTISGIASYIWRTTGTVITGGSTAINSLITTFAEGIYNLFIKAIDNAGNEGGESQAGTLTVDTSGPSVTINQAVGQSDPTTISPINFTVVFSESTSDFATGDVEISGTANATTATVTGTGTTYNIAVTGMLNSGTVIVSINAGVAHDSAGNENGASTTSDASVTWNINEPTPTPTTTPANDSPVVQSLTTPSPIKCDDKPSMGNPDLFEIRATKNTAELFFAPPPMPYSNFYIAYSRKLDIWEYGTQFDQGYSSGILKYTIKSLSPNSKYYFIIRSGNGCATGGWSKTMIVNTTNDNTTKIYYKNTMTAVIQKSKSIIKSILKPSKTEMKSEESIIFNPTQTPISKTFVNIPTVAPFVVGTPAPKTSIPVKTNGNKFCILWWCF